MKKIIDTLNKAVDAFTDALVEEICPMHEVAQYKYDELSRYLKKMIIKYPDIRACTISVLETNKIEDHVYSGNKFFIRIVMLDIQKRPIVLKNEDKCLGTMIIASSIDTRLYDLMNGRTEVTLKLKSKEEM